MKMVIGTFLLLLLSLSLSLSLSVAQVRKTSGQQQQQYLGGHNAVRAKVGLPALKWSEKLAKYAAWWAGQRRGDCALLHSKSDYGENLFWGSGRAWKARDAVQAWAEEKPYYNYRTNTCTTTKDCLHYTQMVWRHTKRVGCARLTCSTGDTFIACNYHPHGNVIGQKPF